MPFQRHNSDIKPRTRIHITGHTGTRKTSSLLTFPRPIHIINLPGEKGYATLPLDAPDVTTDIWQDDTPNKRRPSAQVLQEVHAVTVKAMATPGLKTLAIEGLHKLPHVMTDAVTAGAYFAGEDFEPRLYALAHRQFAEYLDMVCRSSVPVVVMTSWAAPEADKPGLRGGSTHLWPDLLGKLAKQILGEFDITAAAVLRPGKPGEPELTGYWQLRPEGEVWGCGLKVNPERAKAIPTYIPQTYAALQAALAPTAGGGKDAN